MFKSKSFLRTISRNASKHSISKGNINVDYPKVPANVGISTQGYDAVSPLGFSDVYPVPVYPNQYHLATPTLSQMPYMAPLCPCVYACTALMQSNLAAPISASTAAAAPLSSYQKLAPQQMPTDLPMDIKENSTGYVIECDVPGLSNEQIKLSIKDHILVIQSDKDEAKFQEGESMRRGERHRGQAFRAVALPENSSEDKISAYTNKGVLKIMIPKEGSKSHHLEGDWKMIDVK